MNDDALIERMGEELRGASYDVTTVEHEGGVELRAPLMDSGGRVWGSLSVVAAPRGGVWLSMTTDGDERNTVGAECEASVAALVDELSVYEWALVRVEPAGVRYPFVAWIVNPEDETARECGEGWSAWGSEADARAYLAELRSHGGAGAWALYKTSTDVPAPDSVDGDWLAFAEAAFARFGMASRVRS